MRKIILSTAYLANIQYYSKLLPNKEVLIERHEHFQRQTFRSRCIICGANGVQILNTPVVKGRNGKWLIKDLKISYDLDWQKNHLKTIESAYRASPFYEFYIEDFMPYYTKKFDFLLDYNLELQNTVCQILGIECEQKFTDTFIANYNHELYDDYRNSIHPKNQHNKFDKQFRNIPYKQVFSEKFSFFENLSIIDLIFNEGTNAYNILNKSIVKDDQI